MSDNRKYYYLKLKENYFDDDSIRQRSCTGSSRSAGIGRNQAALEAIYQPDARLCVSPQRPAERKNVIYQTRCQEPYSASDTFFVNLIKKSLTICLWC